jgi:hypothetical protein
VSESTEVAVIQNPAQEVDRYKDDGGGAIEHHSLPAPREMNALWKMAGAYSQMPGMSAAYANNQPAVMAALLTAWQLDLPTTPMIVNEFFSWTDSGRTQMYPSTAIVSALAAKNGVELWFDENSDSTFATAFVQRRGDDRVHSYTYTIDQARSAGLLGKSNWKAAPDVMLRYRSARRLLKSVAPDVVLGIPSSILNAEPIPVRSRAELEAAAVPVTVTDEDEEVGHSPSSAEEAGSIPASDDSSSSACSTPGCTIDAPHKHDPAVAARPSVGEWDERPFTDDAA